MTVAILALLPGELLVLAQAAPTTHPATQAADTAASVPTSGGGGSSLSWVLLLALLMLAPFALMMLALFSYPLRKHFRFMHGLGKVKWWFLVHIVLGIGGPLLILVHSTFRVGSLNAGVALYSMIIVALSGVVGRFIYVRVNRGLHGEQTTLREVQVRAGLDQSETRSRLHFAPAVEARLLAFEEHELKARPGWPTFLRQVLLLPWVQWRIYSACVAELQEPLQRIAEQRGWGDADRARRERQARKLIRRYLNNVVRVAQFTAYERLFALWHVAHVPFVYLLVISAVVHVFAVHAY